MLLYAVHAWLTRQQQCCHIYIQSTNHAGILPPIHSISSNPYRYQPLSFSAFSPDYFLSNVYVDMYTVCVCRMYLSNIYLSVLHPLDTHTLYLPLQARPTSSSPRRPKPSAKDMQTCRQAAAAAAAAIQLVLPLRPAAAASVHLVAARTAAEA